MSPIALRSAIVASLIAGEVQWSIGRLLADRTRAGDVVPLDPATAGELKADDRPAFILSTEGAATDNHVVRQHWDVTRGAKDGPGTPVLWNHDADVLLGQWEDHSVETIDVAGPALIARANLDLEDALAQQRRRQIRTGILRATSVGWIPGARVRRGSLKEGDKLFRPMEDDECGQPMEGFVMGTEAEPNILIEASLTPCPADARAVLLGRQMRAVGQIGALARGERVQAVDLRSILLALRDNSAIRAWVRRFIVEDAEIRTAIRSILSDSALPTEGESIASLFPGG